MLLLWALRSCGSAVGAGIVLSAQMQACSLLCSSQQQ
jgi:hypothetical protein